MRELVRIVHVSNIVSHHQLPLAQEFVHLVGEHNFSFCASDRPDLERERLGWNADATEPWIVRAGEDGQARAHFENVWNNADVVICGERLFDRFADRLARGQLCFYMSERWWKPPLGRARLLWPPFLKLAAKLRALSTHPRFHYLPIGPFAERDMAWLARFGGRAWRWGYFTELAGIAQPIERRVGTLKILWVGRMLALKKVDSLIRALGRLRRQSADFELTLIGDGPERSSLENLAARVLDRKTYAFRSPVPAAIVPDIMRQHHVLVLSSNGYEGWGAVVNEAMAAGCAVVASDATGSAAAMIENGVNGLLYRSADEKSLAGLLRRLADDENLRQSLVQGSLHTIQDVWSPHVAAERFVDVASALLGNKTPPVYLNGPMSRVAH